MAAAFDVFTPAKPVDLEMFAQRRHERLQQRVEGALQEAGRQLVLFGPTGVGKTTLVRNVCRGLGLGVERIGATTPFESMVSSVIAQLSGTITTAVSETTEDDLHVEARVPILKGAAGSRSTKVSHADVPARPLPQLLIEALERAGKRILFIDNFEDAEAVDGYEKTVRQLGNLIKEFSDRADEHPDAPTLVIAGIPSATEELIALEQAVARRTVQIEVPRMQPDELGEILDRGAEKEAIEFDRGARAAILDASDGFPYYTHLFARHALAVATERTTSGLFSRRVKVGRDDFERALDRAVDDAHLALHRGYAAGAERHGERRPRKKTMEALAALDAVEGSLHDIRESYRRLNPNETHERLTFISRAADTLVKKEVFHRRQVPGHSAALYQFRDPLMRGFVRLQARYPELEARISAAA